MFRPAASQSPMIADQALPVSRCFSVCPPVGAAAAVNANAVNANAAAVIMISLIVSSSGPITRSLQSPGRTSEGPGGGIFSHSFLYPDMYRQVLPLQVFNSMATGPRCPGVTISQRQSCD